MTEIKRRISQLPNILNVRKSIFFDKIGVASSGFRGDALNGDVYSDVIVRIVSEFPQVSIEWLLQGKGDVIKNTNNSSSYSIGAENQGNLIIGKGSITPCSKGSSKGDRIELEEILQLQLQEKDAQIASLSAMLLKAQETIHALTIRSVGANL